MEKLHRFIGRHTGHPPREEIGQPEQPKDNVLQGSETTGNPAAENSRAAEIIKREQGAWERVLGTPVEVKPLPEYVTPKVQRNFERLGTELLYVPALSLDQDKLVKVSTQEYVEELAQQYPKWKPHEQLSDKEKANPKVSRNLEQWYWEQVKKGTIDFPQLPGQWMAVELRQRIDSPIANRRMYNPTKLRDHMRFDIIKNMPFDDRRRFMQEAKSAILSEAGLEDTPADVRFLEAHEWNLLANRGGWHYKEEGEQTQEWTNTAYRGARRERRVHRAGAYEYDPYRLAVGASSKVGRLDFTGGTVKPISPGERATNIDHRTAIVLGSGK